MTSDKTETRSAPDVKFAYWVPNVSGGLVVSKIEQRTDWQLRLQQASSRSLAENSRLRVRAQPGPLHGELRRRVPARVDHVQPGAAAGDAAAQGASPRFTRACGSRASLAKLVGDGRSPVERSRRGQRRQRLVQGRVHRARRALARARRALSPLRGVHSRAARQSGPQDHFTFSAATSIASTDYNLKPKPVQKPHPEIFQGGNSRAARDMAAACPTGTS